MKCWRCEKSLNYGVVTFQEAILLPDGKEVIIRVTPEMGSPPVAMHPLLCELCWTEVMNRLADSMNRKFKEL